MCPLLGSVSAGLGGRWLGTRGSCVVTCFSLFTSFFLSLCIWYEAGLLASPVYIDLGTWFQIGSLGVHWGMYFDSLTSCMMCTVTLVSFCVHVYSVGYMQAYAHVPRFMSYLSLFTFFMLVLVSADNMLQMLVGWEGIGVCSYLLIGFWFNRIAATKSALKAMLVNRVSDTFLFISVLCMWWYLGSTEYVVFMVYTEGVYYLDFICFTMLVGAMGKSAQVGLHVWLADAMEGPTPVSALIHAATLVTAGVYLLVRTSVLWECSYWCRSLCTWVGALTSLVAATCGLFQNDMKRVIAYSTCSQLGYMMVCCGLCHYSLAIYHLMTHACFKALLFLSAGVVIHAMHDIQDIRKHGGLQTLLPQTWFTLLLGSLSLVGWPFLSGFYSKDAILELCWSSPAYGCLTLVTLFTAYYTFRLLWCGFIQEFSAGKIELPVSGLPGVFWWACTILAIGSLFFGYILSDMLVGLGTDYWNLSVNPHPGTEWVSSHFLPYPVSWLPLLATLCGIILAATYSRPLYINRL
jgi:proton-translocating NADH-quinone oxidoreductase chain L